MRRSVLSTLATASIALGVAAPTALGGTHAAPKLIGSPTAGKSIFTANCAACHTLKAAGAVGTIGPDLDKLALTEATIIKQVTDGGSSLMGKAAAKYTTQMAAYKGVLTTKQIDNVAAFVYASTHK